MPAVCVSRRFLAGSERQNFGAGACDFIRRYLKFVIARPQAVAISGEK